MRTTFRMCLLSLSLCCTCNSSQAAPPRPGQTEQPPIAKRIYVPHAGYLRTTAAKHLARRAVQRNAFMLAPGQSLSLTGTRALPVICVEFNNVAQPFPTNNYQEMLFGAGNAASMSSYYRDISRQRFAVTGQVVGWYKAPQNDTFYENGNNGDGLPFGKFLEFALTKSDQDLDFGLFDNDGPDGRPNSGDDDGKVDTVFLIHPETGAECNQGTNIWSHSWHYSEPTYGHSGPFVTQDVRLDANGNPKLNPNGTPMHIVVEDYTIQPGQACGSNNDQIVEIGVFCHEFGHALGLPDFYDRTPANAADSEGTGNWCLMAGGSYGGNGSRADRPTHMSAWAKYYLGWANMDTIQANGPQQFFPVNQDNEIYRLLIPNTQNLEYFLLEYRRNGAAMPVNWDEFLPGSGLAVWHIDERVGQSSSAWPFSGNDQGQNDSAVRLNSAPPPLFRPKHPLVSLVQADGLMHLDKGQNRGDAGDLFTSGNFEDDPSGKKGSRGFDGLATGIAVRQIQLAANQISAQVTVAGGTPAPSPAPTANAAPPATDDATSNSLKSIAQKFIPHLNDASKLEETAKSLNAEEQQTLQTVGAATLYRVLPTDSANALAKAGSQLRTKKIQAADNTQTEVDQAVQRLVQKSEDQVTATLHYVPGRQRASQITGLKVQSTKPTAGDDAAERVAEDPDLKQALGLKASFVATTPDKTSQVQSFQQLQMVEGQALPVFNSNLSLNYDGDRRLVAATADVVAPTMSVVGAETTLNNQMALEQIKEALSLPAEALEGSVEKGLYAQRPTAGNGEATARVVYRVKLRMGDHQLPLDVFLDAESKRIFFAGF